MAIRVASVGQSDLRIAATQTKRNFITALNTSPFSGDVVGHWRAVFVRLPAGYATLNQRYAMMGWDSGGAGSYNTTQDWTVRLNGGANATVPMRPQITDASVSQAWAGTEGNIGSVPQLVEGAVYLVVAGVANTGSNASPVWRNYAAICPAGGTASSQVAATATAAGFLTGTTQRIFHQVFTRAGSTRTPQDVALEEVVYVTGDFPWDTANNRPHHDALQALAASGTNPFLTYEGLIAAQNAGGLPYANCRQGKGRAEYRFTLRSLATGLANTGAITGNLSEQGTVGGLADVTPIAPSHWLPTPTINETFDKFIPGRGARAFTFTGSYPSGTTALERRWTLRGTSTPVTGRDWADITGISGGNWSLTETVPLGNCDLEVRDKNTPSVTTISADWLSGTRVLFHGQSAQALSVRSGYGSNPLGTNFTSTVVASGAQGSVMRLNNMYANGGSGATYAAPGPSVGRMRSGETPDVGQGAVTYLNEWNAIFPGHPLQICNMAINTHSMDNWSSNIAVPDGDPTWKFLGPVTPAAPGVGDGLASGVVCYFAFLLGSYVDVHEIMWSPGMSDSTGAAGDLVGSGTGRAGYIAAIDARFSGSPTAPWNIIPPWRFHRSAPDINANANIRQRHLLFLSELGARGYLGPTWNDVTADGNGSGHPAYNTSFGNPDTVQNTSDGNHTGQGRLGLGKGRALARVYNSKVKANGGRLIGAYFGDGTRNTIVMEVGRQQRTLNSAALYAGQFWVSTDNGATFVNTGFTAALSADGTRVTLTSTGSAWPASNVRAEVHYYMPFGPNEMANESGGEVAFYGLLYDNQIHRGALNLAAGGRAGNPLQGTCRNGVGNAGVPVLTKGSAALVTTEKFTGNRNVTVRLMADDGVTVLREKMLAITAS